jgi:hypothetical protein
MPAITMTRYRTLLWIGLALCGFAPGGTLEAQSNEDEFPPLNFAFAAYVGSGIYSGGSQVVWLFRAPFTVPLRPQEDRSFGVRLRVRGTVGFFNFNPNKLSELNLPDNVGTLSLLGGVDFPIRVRDNWTLAPFVDLGPAWDSQTDMLSWVLGLGVWSRAEWELKSRNRFVLWTELVRANNFGDDEFEEDDFGKFLNELELRIPLNWHIKGHRMAVGPFVKAVWLWDTLIIGGVTDDPREIRERYEVGFKIGAEERQKFMKVAVPRLGFSYRFGQGVTSVRFIVSARY